MKLSTKGRYALIGLMELALNENRRPVPLIEISRSLGISLSYIEQLFAALRSKGLVKGTRGPGGGYRLTDKAHGTSIAEIFALFEKDTDNGDEPAIKTDYPPYELWLVLSSQIYGFLDQITLGDFIRDNAGKLDRATAA
jgi:Rrf2 family iron-sulfur cluster assembly transcriptional regulator